MPEDNPILESMKIFLESGDLFKTTAAQMVVDLSDIDTVSSIDAAEVWLNALEVYVNIEKNKVNRKLCCNN